MTMTIRIIIPTVTPPIRPALDPPLAPKLLKPCSLGDPILPVVITIFLWPEVIGNAVVCLVTNIDILVFSAAEEKIHQKTQTIISPCDILIF